MWNLEATNIEKACLLIIWLEHKNVTVVCIHKNAFEQNKWQFGVVVMSFIASPKLLYIEPGYEYLMLLYEP